MWNTNASIFQRKDADDFLGLHTLKYKESMRNIWLQEAKRALTKFEKSHPKANMLNFKKGTDGQNFILFREGKDKWIPLDSYFKKKYGQYLTNGEVYYSPHVKSPKIDIQEVKKDWPKIWSKDGKVPKFSNLRYPNNPYREGWKTHGVYRIADDQFQKPVNLGYPIHNFRVYVNEKDYFMANLPPIKASWSQGKVINEKTNYDIRRFFDYKDQYFSMICGAYISSFLCGISLRNLQNDDQTSNIITTIARYHLYYTIRKFMKDPSLISKYNVNDVKKYLPIRHNDYDSIGTDGDGNHYVVRAKVNWSDHDYASFIAYSSDGLTEIGRNLLQASMESFVYSILGSQAKTRWSIVNDGAKSSQTQDVFRKLVEDTIIQSNTTVTISNMRRAIIDTNVVLNMAICPGVILAPSSMIILKKPIPGFNNVLTLATSGMVFGKNTNVNYVGVKKEPHKKIHQPSEPTEHLDNLTKETKDVVKKISSPSTMPNKPSSDNTSTLIIVIAGATYLLLKYML